MSLSDADIAFALELFEGVGPITHRKMFGGMGIYLDGKIFALRMSDGGLLLKGAGPWADEMAAMGWPRWTYARDGGKTAAMPYWFLPEAALDDPEVACDHARRALACL